MFTFWKKPTTLLTNSGEIRKNIKKLQNLTFFTQKDSFKLIPKKEQAQINRDVKKLEKIYGGISNFNGKIDVLFVIGLKKEQVARKEVNMLSIPIISVCNTNANPNGIDCVLVGNDENIKSVEFFASWVADSILLARGESIERKQEEGSKFEETDSVSQSQENPETLLESNKVEEEKNN